MNFVAAFPQIYLTINFYKMETTYSTTNIQVKGNNYSVTVAKGGFNYVNVLKKTNNPFGVSGKNFENFDAAQQHYKCKDMKVALLKLELGIS